MTARVTRWSSRRRTAGLGDACFDLGSGKGAAELGRGQLAYERAEVLLAEVEAPVEKATLDFKYANTLFALSVLAAALRASAVRFAASSGLTTSPDLGAESARSISWRTTRRISSRVGMSTRGNAGQHARANDEVPQSVTRGPPRGPTRSYAG